jgi:hypothetical protein
VLGAVGAALAVKDVYKSLKKGDYGRAALSTALTVASFTPLRGVVMAGAVYVKYQSDRTIEQRAFEVGDRVQAATGSVVIGGLASAGSAVGIAAYEVGADLVHGVRNFFNDW